MGNESSRSKGLKSGKPVSSIKTTSTGKNTPETSGAGKKSPSSAASSGNASPSSSSSNVKTVKKESSSSEKAERGKESPRDDDKRANESTIMGQIDENQRKKKVSLDDFVLLTVVGKGSFGKVIQVKEKKTNKIYAMKVLKKEQVIKRKQFEHTMAERRILEEIDHPFIVSLRFAFQTTQKLYMVFDYFNGGELFHYLSKTGKFSEERARFYAAEIALALEHVHAMNIIYRDLKPENLLLDADGHIKVTDFGLSKENVVDDNVRSFCGTPEYLAPEVLKRQTYGKAVDWWSLGTLLYEMISGLPPFYDRNRDKMYKRILGDELKFPAHMVAEARSICRGMLQRDPLQRLGYRGAQEIKTHPFFASIDFDALLNKEIEPPFKPKVQGNEDTRNVDPTFTGQATAITPTPAENMLSRVNEEFPDFTYTQVGVFGDGASYRVTSAPLEEELG